MPDDLTQLQRKLLVGGLEERQRGSGVSVYLVGNTEVLRAGSYEFTAERIPECVEALESLCELGLFQRLAPRVYMLTDEGARVAQVLRDNG